MHNTEVKTDIVIQQHQDQLPHHSQTSVSHGRRMTNGDGMVTTGSSRHHRDGTSIGMGTSSNNNECAGCGKRITDRFLLKALDLFWHEDCLKCGCCDCRLGEVGSTLYTKANLILCKRDYLRLFGNTGYCAACSKVIPAFEMVMRARNNVYHLECFACQQCNHRFCVGDRFYLCENKILCEYDYEERMVFANMACSPGNLAILRRQVSTFQPGTQSEQQQQPQQQFHSSSSSILNDVNQYHQFDQQQQHKYTLNVPFSKVPVSEPLSIGTYPSTAISPSSSSSSDKHCSETGYITTKQTRVRERTDPFLIVKYPNLASSPPPQPPPPCKRPKQSFSTYDNNDNLDSSPILLYSERNNNNNFENLTKPLLTYPTSPIFSPTFLQSVMRTAEDHTTNKSKAVAKVATIAANTNNNAMGSPDSGIVEGP